MGAPLEHPCRACATCTLIAAVYHELLPRLPDLRYCLADDPGAGKTIMAGLLIREALTRGIVHRVLIVSPGSLVEQWQDEMQTRFHLSFHVINRGDIEAASACHWQGVAVATDEATPAAYDIVDIGAPDALCIGRLDMLSRSEDAVKAFERMDWDLVICDEAHKVSATVSMPVVA